MYKDYEKLLEELENAQKGLVKLLTLENSSEATEVGKSIARVQGILQAWNYFQQKEMDELGEWAEGIVNGK